jgi:hypothetical protein
LQNMTFVEELRQTICEHRVFYNLCLFRSRNGRIFSWILLQGCPAQPKDMILFGSLWIVSQRLFTSFQWMQDIQPRSMPRCILIALWPSMEFLLLSFLIAGQFSCRHFGLNSRNVLVLAFLEVQLTIHRPTVRQKG